MKHQDILIRIFQNVRDLSLELPVVHPCEKQCTDGEMDMKVYDKLLDRYKWKATKDSSDNNTLFFI